MLIGYQGRQLLSSFEEAVSSSKAKQGSVVAGQLLKTLKACAMIKTLQRREDYN